MENTRIDIRMYKKTDQPYFEGMNRRWIEKFFDIEPIDEYVLTKPDQAIIEEGGVILMADYNKEVAGTVALKLVGDNIFEFTKMAVAEKFRRNKIGETLAHAALTLAKQKGAEKVVLYSNRKLDAAIALYRKIGFQEVPVDPIYKRGDIKMEIRL